MSVSDRVREIERAIDAEIRELKIWRRSRAAVLADLMRTYRDAIEVVFLELFFLQTHTALDVSASDVGNPFAQENRLRAGVLWSLKWASEFCPENGSSEISAPDELIELLSLGAAYEAFVDVLKYANHELVDIKIDEQSRTLICYEGRQATGFDAAIVLQQRITNPRTQQVSLTEDGDQITSRWVAGDYRRVMRDLASYAASKESELCMDPAYLAQLGMPDVSIPQPTLIWFDRPSRPPDCQVFEDLVLPTVIDSALKWKLVALLDTPIVRVDQKYCALSSDIKALSQIDDHMLRLAARVDERQYTIAASLREDRMVDICKDAFDKCSPSWSVRDRVHFSNPTQQADVVATRASESLVLELKSTLRPETPWETYKRNDDIIHGIKQAKALVDRGVATYGFVVTDGYRGDYACWAEALSSDTAIGTLSDLVEIASDPATAVSALQAKVGITENSVPPHGRLPDRETTVAGWKLRLVDMEAPQK